MISYEEFYQVLHTVMADNGQGRFDTESNSRKLFLLTEHLIEVSKVMNLTAIKEEKAIILKHLADSLSVADFLPENAKMIDVGCGAGFPCLPLAICRPDLTITALDSTEKRVRYVSETAKLLELQNLTGIAARAEEAGKVRFVKALTSVLPAPWRNCPFWQNFACRSYRSAESFLR